MFYNNFYTHRTSMILDECNYNNNNGACGSNTATLDSAKFSKRKNRKNILQNPKKAQTSNNEELPLQTVASSALEPSQPQQLQAHEQSETPNLIGFRELPVDCPHNSFAINNKLVKSASLMNGADEIIVEKARRELVREQYEHLKRILSSNSIEKTGDIYDEYFLRDANNNFADANTIDLNRTGNNLRLTRLLASNRRVFLRNSSLSTISEKKSLNTLSPTSISSFTNTSNEVSSDAHSASTNGIQVVQNLLNEFHDKNVIINEILHVFEPSSKGGNFNRNIPIRLSSPLKPESQHESSIKSSSFSNSSSTSPLSPLYTSALTTADNCNKDSNNISTSKSVSKSTVTNEAYYNELKVFLGNSSSLLNLYSPNTKLNAKKTRLMKRLKNRIETKKGKALLSDKKLFNSVTSVESSQSFIKNRGAGASFRTNKSPSTIYSRINHFRASLVSFEKVRKFDAVDSDLNQLYSINQSIRSRMDESSDQDSDAFFNYDLPKSSIILNNSIEPAYF